MRISGVLSIEQGSFYFRENIKGKKKHFKISRKLNAWRVSFFLAAKGTTLNMKKHEEGTLKENPSYAASKDTQVKVRGPCVQQLS